MMSEIAEYDYVHKKLKEEFKSREYRPIINIIKRPELEGYTDENSVLRYREKNEDRKGLAFRKK